MKKREVIQFPAELWNRLRHGFVSYSISDGETLETIEAIYRGADRYLLDPHGAVALAAAQTWRQETPGTEKIVCLATAHPAKFPQVIGRALKTAGELPEAARHASLELAKKEFHHLRICSCEMLEQALATAIRRQIVK